MCKALFVGMVLLGVAIAQAQQVWCVGESTKVKPSDSPQAANLTWKGDSKTVTLGSARNEYVAFQIAIRADREALKDVTVESADLAGPAGAVISKANIDLFVEHYLNVTVSSRGDAEHLSPGCTAGEHPTQMVPFDAKKYGAPFEVGAGRNQPVWVDIYVPEDAKAGDYSGSFKVKAGGQVAAELNVALQVWNFTLPNETHFRSYLYTGPENLRWGHRLGGTESPEFYALADKYFQMAHQHRINFNLCGGTGLEEVLDTYYKYYDGSGFTQRVGKGVGQNVACITPTENGNEAQFKAQAGEMADKWERKKPNAVLFAYIWDEPHSAEDFATSKKYCKWLHEAVGKRINTFIATPQYEKYDPGDVNFFSEPSEQDIPAILKRGDSVWSVNDGYTSGTQVDAPGFGGRSIVWMVWKMKTEGWQLWDVCYWVDSQNRKHQVNGRWVKDMTMDQINADPGKYLTHLWNDPLNFDESRKQGYPLNDSIRSNGGGILFYPGYEVGIDGPIASYQMKSVRRGAQDMEYLWLLKQQGKEAQTTAIVDSVVPAPNRWNDNPESWDQARLDLAKLLNKP